jgi:hypothetical protein
MTRFLWSTYIVLWLLVAILTLLVLLLYRQYGRAMLPAKERMQLAGLDIGTSVRQLVIAEANGAETRIPLSGASGNVVLRVILLAASHCPICASLWEQVGDLPSEQRAVEHWWIQSGEPKDDPAPQGWRIVSDNTGSVQRALEAPAIPYAYALDTSGVVRAKGLMNDLDDFRDLIGRASRGMPELAVTLSIASKEEVGEQWIG